MVNPLRRWRIARGLSQPQLGAAVGVAQSTINRIEAGHGCNADTAYRLILYAEGELRLIDLVSEVNRDAA
jgi:transcriptional regulator with XRE-family HTH domain